MKYIKTFESFNNQFENEISESWRDYLPSSHSFAHGMMHLLGMSIPIIALTFFLGGEPVDEYNGELKIDKIEDARSFEYGECHKVTGHDKNGEEVSFLVKTDKELGNYVVGKTVDVDIKKD